MPESATHATLVQTVICFTEREFGALANIAIREDSVRPMRGERPPRIAGYTPDIYATDVPTTRTLVGEAKTRADLETEHSRRQIAAFLAFLSKTPNAVFVLAVPLSAGPTARRLAFELNTPFVGSATRIVVLDGASTSAW